MDLRDKHTTDDEEDYKALSLPLGIRIGPSLVLVGLNRIRVAERRGMIVTALRFDMPIAYVNMFVETKIAQRNRKVPKLVSNMSVSVHRMKSVPIDAIRKSPLVVEMYWMLLP